jgi:hypothetical protein
VGAKWLVLEIHARYGDSVVCVPEHVVDEEEQKAEAAAARPGRDRAGNEHWPRAAVVVGPEQEVHVIDPGRFLGGLVLGGLPEEAKTLRMKPISIILLTPRRLRYAPSGF